MTLVLTINIFRMIINITNDDTIIIKGGSKGGLGTAPTPKPVFLKNINC